MSEEEEKTEGEDESPEDPKEGDESETDEKVKQLNADTKRINEAIAENENAKAREKLGGKSEAGQVAEPKKEPTPKEYKDKVMSGEIPEK